MTHAPFDPPRTATPESLASFRARHSLDEVQAARVLNVPLVMFLRWERGQSRAHPCAAQVMWLVDSLASSDRVKGYLERMRTYRKAGRPVGSRNVPAWLRPSDAAPPGPKRPVGRPKGSKTDPRARVGRPRDPESTRPMRRACRHCGRTVTGGRLFHPDCLAESMGEVRALRADLVERREHARTLADGGDQAVFPLPEPRPSDPTDAPKACRVPVSGVACGAPCETGYICAPHRASLGMVRPA